MLALTTEQRAALEGRAVMRRTFIWCEARDPDTGLPAPAGFWDDIGDVELDGRVYHGSGGVIAVSSLSAGGDLTIPGLSITLSGIDTTVNLLVRGKSIGQAPVSVRIGMFDVASHVLIPPLFPLFIGYIDDCTISTPEAGGNGEIVFTCESTSRALTRRATGTRSDATQKQRDPTDGLYLYAGAQRHKPLYFGKKEPVAAAPSGGAALLGGKSLL